MMISGLKHNKAGIVLLIVIFVTITLSIVAAGIISLNVSQVTSSRSVVDTIQAEQLAIGAYYQYHQRQMEGEGSASGSETFSQTYSDGTTGDKTFNLIIQEEVEDTGPNETKKIDTVIEY